ncbi:hypothetical protein AWD77_004516, partial [Escherichia coli]
MQVFFTPDGADKLFDARGDVVVKPFVIHQRQDAVTDGYIRRGYITSRAFLTEQDLSGG